MYEFKTGGKETNTTLLKIRLSTTKAFQLIRSLLVKLEQGETAEFNLYGSMVRGIEVDPEPNPNVVVVSRKFADALLAEHEESDKPEKHLPVLLLFANEVSAVGWWDGKTWYSNDDKAYNGGRVREIVKWKHIRWSKDDDGGTV